MPKMIQRLPVDSRGFPVPVITPREAGKYFLGKVDNHRVLICFIQSLCAVCGGSMIEPWRFYTSPFRERHNEHKKLEELFSSMHANNALLVGQGTGPSEGSVHYECGLYSRVVCPFLAVTTAKFTGMKESGGPTIDRMGMYFGQAKIANFDPVTLRAAFHPPLEVMSDSKIDSLRTLQSLEHRTYTVPDIWDLDESDLQREIMRTLKELNERLYHRVRQGKGVWGR